MTNETLWVDGESSADAGGYVVTLSVFHELHCLVRHTFILVSTDTERKSGFGPSRPRAPLWLER